MPEHNDYPVKDVLQSMSRQIAKGWTCYVKFTCAKCGSRQTSDEPNTYHLAGYTCEECGHLTKPEKINFMMMQEP